MIPPLLTHTDLEGLTFAHRGKVRDVYEVDAEHVLLVATDRVSAFDSVLSPGIPYKGAVLNALSAHWFAKLAEGGFSTHFVSARLSAMPAAVQAHAAALRGRITLARRVEIVPVECVVRGYLAGSAVKAYAKDQALHGVPLPGGLVPGDRFPEPVFTPTTKEASGHDEPITYDDVVRLHGAETAALLRERSLAAYRLAAAAAEERGLILVDTKLEFGRDGSGELVIADEVFTADSSRYWLASDWSPGVTPAPLDKQLVRNHLLACGWDREPPPPPLPPRVVIETTRRYLELFERVTGHHLEETPT